MMEDNEWEKISGLFERALELPAAERRAFLGEIARSEGEVISHEVEALLRADQNSDGFLNSSALNLAAQQLAVNCEQIRPNAQFGNYRILSRLGAGGMGEVYLALDEKLGRRVALKFLPQLFMRDETQLERFEREARAASALNHPNILTVYEIGNTGGRTYIAMEYVEGKTLRTRISEQNFTHEEILNIAEQIGEALNTAHRAGLIHRDIKPENIMLRPDGYVKLLDFGLAKPLNESAMVPTSNREHQGPKSGQQTRHGLILGTPGYMSPEQARGEALDGRSDLWSLGATIYEMLIGNALVAGDASGPAMVEMKLGDHQYLFRPILQNTLAWELGHRYQNARDFLAEVRKVKVALERSKQKKFSAETKNVIAAALFLLISVIGLMAWREPATLKPVSKISNQESVPASSYYWELSESEKSAFIRETAHNIAKMLGENPSALSPEHAKQIKKHVEAYMGKRNSLSTAPGNESMKAVYARASVYAPFIIEAFHAHRLPPILGLYIAMNETEYHPCTESPVGAKGLFSFMPQTAERYGLRLAPEDERCNPRKIADAAARYLEDLTKIYGRDADGLSLSMMAYNCGERCVYRALADLKAKNIEPGSFWVLVDYNDRLSIPLQQETRNYTPRFFAAAILGEYPERFGLEIHRLSTYTTQQ